METQREKRRLLAVEAYRGMILMSISVILGNCCFPTYSTTIRINLKTNLPQERKQAFPAQVSLPAPPPQALGPTRQPGQRSKRAELGSPSHGNRGD